MTVNRLTEQAGYSVSYPARTGSNDLLLYREINSRIFPTYSSPPVSSIQEQNKKNMYFFIFVYSNRLLLFFIS